MINQLKKNVPITHRINPYFAALLIFVVSAAILRLKGLTFQSYWYDELYSLMAANPENPYNQVLQETFDSVHPPLFHTLLWLWFKVFGFSELSGRVFPALFGILTIPVMYLLGKELFDGEVGVYAAGIATVNPFLLYYSQEVRPYSLFLLLSLLSLFLYLKVLKHLRYRDFAFYLITTGALMYTHYFGLLVIGVEALFLAVYLPSNRHNISQIIGFGAVTTLTFILFLSPLLLSIIADASRDTFWIVRPESDFLIDYMEKFFGESSIIMILIISLMVIALSQISSDRIRGETKLGFSFLTIWIIVVTTVPYLVSIFFVPVLISRNLIILLPAIILLISFGLKYSGIKKLKLFVFFVLIILSSTTIFYEQNYYHKISKEQFRYLINNVIEKNTNIPVYAHKSARPISTYAKLLGSDQEIKSIQDPDILSDLAEQDGCFFIVERNHRFKHGEVNSFIEENNFRIVRKINKVEASAFLLTRDQTSQHPCVKK